MLLIAKALLNSGADVNANVPGHYNFSALATPCFTTKVWVSPQKIAITMTVLSHPGVPGGTNCATTQISKGSTLTVKELQKTGESSGEVGEQRHTA